MEARKLYLVPDSRVSLCTFLNRSLSFKGRIRSPIFILFFSFNNESREGCKELIYACILRGIMRLDRLFIAFAPLLLLINLYSPVTLDPVTRYFECIAAPRVQGCPLPFPFFPFSSNLQLVDFHSILGEKRQVWISTKRENRIAIVLNFASKFCHRVSLLSSIVTFNHYFTVVICFSSMLHAHFECFVNRHNAQNTFIQLEHLIYCSDWPRWTLFSCARSTRRFG